MTAEPSANLYAPPSTTVTPTSAPSAGGVFERDRYYLRQKWFAISERYKVFGDDDEELLYMQRPARVVRRLLAVGVIVVGVISAIATGGALMAANPVVGVVVLVAMIIAAVVFAVIIAGRRHLRICRDQALTDLVLTISQDNLWQLPIAHWSLRDAQGTVVARFRKNLLWNLVRRRWGIHRPDGELALLVKEDSLIKSIVRRVAPNIIAVFMRTNFVFLDVDSGRQLGVFNRKLALRDHYLLDLSADVDRVLDRRVALAMGVLLDTGERR